MRFTLRTYRTIRKSDGWMFKAVTRSLAASDREQAEHLADNELLDVLGRAKRLRGHPVSYATEMTVAFGIYIV